jgi:predicted dehydrogenase/threonine dehydrogenase-like Zn-dependent dehydrogenase
MRQVVQNYNNGEVELVDVPAPILQKGNILVRTASSLVSIGTERTMIETANKSLLGKARARPDLVRQLFDKIQSDGLAETYRQARARLDTPVPLGYSAAGTIISVGDKVNGFSVGDSIACAGHPYAGHAEVLSVPQNLCVKMPGGVSFEEASFVMLGAIALHAVRLTEPALGERIAVIGLGLLGLLSVQLLRAAGCDVIGIDIAPDKLEMAQQLGVKDVFSGGGDALAALSGRSDKLNVDATIIFASTSSNEPIEQAAAITRERGRIVIPGLVSLDIPRRTFYEKELRLIVSRAGGPGANDPHYERSGKDYPSSFVRWTQGRNMSKFLDLIADGRVQVAPLITHRIPFCSALDAYSLVKGKASGPTPIGIVLNYETEQGTKPESSRLVWLKSNGPITRPPLVRSSASTKSGPPSSIGIGLIGAGLFARGTLLPILKKTKEINLRGVCTASGINARHASESAGFAYCSSDYRDILDDPDVHAVLVATRHDIHADLVVDILQAGKHVFVEKPLALSLDQLRRVLAVYKTVKECTENSTCMDKSGVSRGGRFQQPILMVGFNRRFAPATQSLLAEIGNSGPAIVHCRINAGPVPSNSWVNDSNEGGGRIIGEVCHFVDLVQALTGGVTISVAAMAADMGNPEVMPENLSISLKLDNGSIGNIVYVANGDKSFPRERVEVFRGGGVGVIENFREYSLTRGGKKRRHRSIAVDRGHQAELDTFFRAIRTGQPPVSMEDYAVTTLATFAINLSLVNKEMIDISLADAL